MGISKGLDFLRRQQEAAASRDNRQNIFKLWVTSGDTAKFYFLVQDVDKDLMAPMLHSLEKTVTKDSDFRKRGDKFEVDVLCSRENKDDPYDLCEYCREGVKWLGHRLVSWVWVETIAHDKLKINKTTGQPQDWELMTIGKTKKVYVETPDPRVRLLIMKSKLAQQVMKKFDELDSLFDRPYKIEKTGTGQQTMEMLTCSDDESPIPEEVLAAYANLPSLEEAVRQEFGRWTTQKKPELGGRGIYTPSGEVQSDSGLVEFDL